MIKKHLNKIILFTFSAIIIIALFASVSRYFTWQKSYHYGKIVSVAGNSFLLEDPKGETKTVNILPNTKIWHKNRTDSNFIKPAVFVMVVGKINDQNQIDAEVVRPLPQKNNEIFD